MINVEENIIDGSVFEKNIIDGSGDIVRNECDASICPKGYEKKYIKRKLMHLFCLYVTLRYQ